MRLNHDQACPVIRRNDVLHTASSKDTYSRFAGPHLRRCYKPNTYLQDKARAAIWEFNGFKGNGGTGLGVLNTTLRASRGPWNGAVSQCDNQSANPHAHLEARTPSAHTS